MEQEPQEQPPKKPSKRPPILPLRAPPKIFLDNKITYQRLLKKNYKLVSTLEIMYDDSHLDVLTKSRKMRNSLYELAKRVKVQRHLDLYNCHLHGIMNDSDALELIYRFSYLKSITLPFHYNDDKILKTSIEWLRKLTHLKSAEFKYRDVLNKASNENKELLNKFLMTLKMKRLEALNLNFQTPSRGLKEDLLKELLTFRNYSAKLKTLVLSWNKILTALLKKKSLSESMKIDDSGDKSQYFGFGDGNNLSHFQRLKCLSLLSKLDSEDVEKMLLTIPSVEDYLVSLAVIMDKSSKNGLLNILNSCKKLKNFALETDNINFAKFKFEKCSLTCLELTYLDKGRNHVANLGLLLGRIPNLRTLKLQINGDECEGESFTSLFQQISKLKELHRLHFFDTTGTDLSKYAEALKVCIEDLNLTTLEFKSATSNLDKKNFQKLVQAIQTQSGLQYLKLRLPMNLNENISALVSLLWETKITKIRELVLDGLILNEWNSFELLCDTISEAPEIRNISLMNMKIKLLGTSLKETLKILLSGFKEDDIYCYLGKNEVSIDKTDLSLDDLRVMVVKKAPETIILNSSVNYLEYISEKLSSLKVIQDLPLKKIELIFSQNILKMLKNKSIWTYYLSLAHDSEQIDQSHLIDITTVIKDHPNLIRLNRDQRIFKTVLPTELWDA